MSEISTVNDMIKTIVNYIMRKRNNKWLKIMKVNEIEQRIKYTNYNIIALSARRIYNLKKSLMTLNNL